MVCIQAGLLTRSILTPSQITMIEFSPGRRCDGIMIEYQRIQSLSHSLNLSLVLVANVKTRFRTYSSGDCSGFTPVFPFQALRLVRNATLMRKSNKI